MAEQSYRAVLEVSGRGSGDRGRRAVRGEPSECARVAAPLPGRRSVRVGGPQSPGRISIRGRFLRSVEAAICELRRQHPRGGRSGWCSRWTAAAIGAVTRSTVYRVLVRNGLIEPKTRRRRQQDYKRWERPVAMELWQLDVTASAFLADGREVKIVTGIDDHSRFCVIAKAVVPGYRPAGLPSLRRRDGCLRGAGGSAHRQRQACSPAGSSSPARPRCCSSGSAGRTASPSGSPSPRSPNDHRQNRAIAPVPAERTARTAMGRSSPSRTLQTALDAWRCEYNTDRPHQSLDMAFPASRFAPATSSSGAAGRRPADPDTTRT